MKKPLTKLVLSISLLLFVASQLSAQSEHPSLFKNLDETEYEKGIVVFRVKSEQKSLSNQGGVYSKGFERFAKGRKIKSIGQAYPHVKQLKKSISKSGVDVSLIYKLELADGESIERAITDLYKSGLVVYAEPNYISQVLYTPNDDNIAGQLQLINSSVFEGWDINKGSTDIIIGISDTGIKLDHPDLVGNLKYNENDPIDLVDNDGDG